jgi:predicted nucleic acid-binding protein
VKALLDTSVLIGAYDPGELEAPSAPPAWPNCTSACSSPATQTSGRALRLGVIESTFEPLPIDAAVAREWGRLAAAVRARGGQPRRRPLDLAIAATASAHDVPLLTHNASDFQLIDDLVTVRTP